MLPILYETVDLFEMKPFFHVKEGIDTTWLKSSDGRIDNIKTRKDLKFCVRSLKPVGDRVMEVASSVPTDQVRERIQVSRGAYFCSTNNLFRSFICLTSY